MPHAFLKIMDTYNNLTQQQKQQFENFSQLLQQENELHNLTRITDPQQIMVKHFFDSLIAAPIMVKYADSIDRAPFLVDVGSGAGFPVIPLAIALPQWNFVSVEATGKKADFQWKAIGELGLENVEVLQERAEEVGRNEEYRQRFDFAITRAVGRLEIIAELTVPLLRKGGIFLTWKGPKVEEEMPAGKKALHVLGMDSIIQIPYTLPGEEQSNYRLVQAVKVKNTPPQYPREFRDIKKSPLK